MKQTDGTTLLRRLYFSSSLYPVFCLLFPVRLYPTDSYF